MELYKSHLYWSPELNMGTPRGFIQIQVSSAEIDQDVVQ